MHTDSLLRSIPLFAHLRESDRQELERQSVEVPCKKGEYIFQEGDPAQWFHIVKEGTVKCVQSSPQGREVTLKVLMPGDLFCCEASAINGAAHPGCAQAMGEAKIVKVDRKVLLDILQRNPDAAIEIISYLGDRLREAQDNAKAFALDSAEHRLASLLMNLIKRAATKEPDGLRITVHLTRQDFADMAGLTLETTSRIMSRFKKEGIIKGSARRLVVCDPTRLYSRLQTQ
jgi:CRP/FNR family cyclic AMP-dependent transcriptional regulator